MKKQDELDMIKYVLSTEGSAGCLINYETPIPKRKGCILEKWNRKGYWDCGVTLRSGWLTQKGRISLMPSDNLKYTLSYEYACEICKNTYESFTTACGEEEASTVAELVAILASRRDKYICKDCSVKELS